MGSKLEIFTNFLSEAQIMKGITNYFTKNLSSPSFIEQIFKNFLQ